MQFTPHDLHVAEISRRQGLRRSPALRVLALSFLKAVNYSVAHESDARTSVTSSSHNRFFCLRVAECDISITIGCPPSLNAAKFFIEMYHFISFRPTFDFNSRSWRSPEFDRQSRFDFAVRLCEANKTANKSDIIYVTCIDRSVNAHCTRARINHRYSSRVNLRPLTLSTRGTACPRT